ncbi:MAG TPA: Hpt domain-containing protein [Caulobacteraceae bacterium]
MAKRDIKGVVDFGYLEDFAAGDALVIDEVLALFREQAAIWAGMLDPSQEGWRDAVHTIKGAARGVGAFQLGEACAWAEAKGPVGLTKVRDALDAALADVAAYAHEQALKSLKSSR